MRCFVPSRAAGRSRRFRLRGSLRRDHGGRRFLRHSPWHRSRLRARRRAGSSFMLNMMRRADPSRARMRRASSNPDTVGRLMSITQMSGCSAVKARSPLSASQASSSTHLGFVGENSAAARSDDGMVVNDQNAHGIGLQCIDLVAAPHQMHERGSKPRLTADHATRAMLLYASNRWPRHCLSTLLLVRNPMQRGRGHASCGRNYLCAPGSTCFLHWFSRSVWPSTLRGWFWRLHHAFRPKIKASYGWRANSSRRSSPT